MVTNTEAGTRRAIERTRATNVRRGAGVSASRSALSLGSGISTVSPTLGSPPACAMTMPATVS